MQVFRLLVRKKVVLCHLNGFCVDKAVATPLPATDAQTIPVESINAPLWISIISRVTPKGYTRRDAIFCPFCMEQACIVQMVYAFFSTRD